MADYLFRKKITHTEKTVEQLYKMQYCVYEKPRMILRAAIGFGLVAPAVISGLPTWGKALPLLISAWLLVSRDFPAAVLLMIPGLKEISRFVLGVSKAKYVGIDSETAAAE